MKRHFLIIVSLVASLLTSAIVLRAEESDKFKVSPSGRVLVDGAVYASPQKHHFKDGMAIPEARLGVKMWYGKWSSWIDVGFAYGKIGLRNMWIQYDFNPNHNLRAGNFLQPFGYQSPVTSNNKPTFEQPLVSAVFTPGLQLGLMYTFKNNSFYSATSFHVESSALTNAMNYPLFNQQGYTFLTRFVWRNKKANEPGQPIFNIGMSLGFSTPDRHLVDDEDIHDGFTNAAFFPTKVSNVTAVSAVIGNAKNRFKLTPEFVCAYRKFGFESQYFWQSIARTKGLNSYQAQGGYVTIRSMILGGDYGYDSHIAQLTHPKKNALEFVADYNYITLSDYRAGILGGRANSVGATLNYYFNPYITARLNYTYTFAWDNPEIGQLSQNAFQLRLMLLF